MKKALSLKAKDELNHTLPRLRMDQIQKTSRCSFKTRRDGKGQQTISHVRLILPKKHFHVVAYGTY